MRERWKVLLKVVLFFGLLLILIGVIYFFKWSWKSLEGFQSISVPCPEGSPVNASCCKCPPGTLNYVKWSAIGCLNLSTVGTCNCATNQQPYNIGTDQCQREPIYTKCPPGTLNGVKWSATGCVSIATVETPTCATNQLPSNIGTEQCPKDNPIAGETLAEQESYDIYETYNLKTAPQMTTTDITQYNTASLLGDYDTGSKIPWDYDNKTLDPQAALWGTIHPLCSQDIFKVGYIRTIFQSANNFEMDSQTGEFKYASAQFNDFVLTDQRYYPLLQYAEFMTDFAAEIVIEKALDSIFGFEKAADEFRKAAVNSARLAKGELALVGKELDSAADALRSPGWQKFVKGPLRNIFSGVANAIDNVEAYSKAVGAKAAEIARITKQTAEGAIDSVESAKLLAAADEVFANSTKAIKGLTGIEKSLGNISSVISRLNAGLNAGFGALGKAVSNALGIVGKGASKVLTSVSETLLKKGAVDAIAAAAAAAKLKILGEAAAKVAVGAAKVAAVPVLDIFMIIFAIACVAIIPAIFNQYIPGDAICPPGYDFNLADAVKGSSPAGVAGWEVLSAVPIIGDAMYAFGPYLCTNSQGDTKTKIRYKPPAYYFDSTTSIFFDMEKPPMAPSDPAFNDIRRYYSLSAVYDITADMSNTTKPDNRPRGDKVYAPIWVDFSHPDILDKMANYYYSRSRKFAQSNYDGTATFEYITKIFAIVGTSRFSCDIICEITSITYYPFTGIEKSRTIVPVTPDSGTSRGHDRRFYFFVDKTVDGFISNQMDPTKALLDGKTRVAYATSGDENKLNLLMDDNRARYIVSGCTNTDGTAPGAQEINVEGDYVGDALISLGDPYTTYYPPMVVSVNGGGAGGATIPPDVSCDFVKSNLSRYGKTASNNIVPSMANATVPAGIYIAPSGEATSWGSTVKIFSATEKPRDVQGEALGGILSGVLGYLPMGYGFSGGMASTSIQAIPFFKNNKSINDALLCAWSQVQDQAGTYVINGNILTTEQDWFINRGPTIDYAPGYTPNLQNKCYSINITQQDCTSRTSIRRAVSAYNAAFGNKKLKRIYDIQVRQISKTSNMNDTPMCLYLADTVTIDPVTQAELSINIAEQFGINYEKQYGDDTCSYVPKGYDRENPEQSQYSVSGAANPYNNTFITDPTLFPMFEPLTDLRPRPRLPGNLSNPAVTPNNTENAAGFYALSTCTVGANPCDDIDLKTRILNEFNTRHSMSASAAVNGPGLTNKNSIAAVSALPAANPTNMGWYYSIPSTENSEKVWVSDGKIWIDTGATSIILKDSVATMSSLPTNPIPDKGEVYNIFTTGEYYVWNGVAWIFIGILGKTPGTQIRIKNIPGDVNASYTPDAAAFRRNLMTSAADPESKLGAMCIYDVNITKTDSNMVDSVLSTILTTYLKIDDKPLVTETPDVKKARLCTYKLASDDYDNISFTLKSNPNPNPKAFKLGGCNQLGIGVNSAGKYIGINNNPKGGTYDSCEDPLIANRIIEQFNQFYGNGTIDNNPYIIPGPLDSTTGLPVGVKHVYTPDVVLTGTPQCIFECQVQTKNGIDSTIDSVVITMNLTPASAGAGTAASVAGILSAARTPGTGVRSINDMCNYDYSTDNYPKAKIYDKIPSISFDVPNPIPKINTSFLRNKSDGTSCDSAFYGDCSGLYVVKNLVNQFNIKYSNAKILKVLKAFTPQVAGGTAVCDYEVEMMRTFGDNKTITEKETVRMNLLPSSRQCEYDLNMPAATPVPNTGYSITTNSSINPLNTPYVWSMNLISWTKKLINDALLNFQNVNSQKIIRDEALRAKTAVQNAYDAVQSARGIGNTNITCRENAVLQQIMNRWNYDNSPNYPNPTGQYGIYQNVMTEIRKAEPNVNGTGCVVEFIEMGQTYEDYIGQYFNKVDATGYELNEKPTYNLRQYNFEVTPTPSGTPVVTINPFSKDDIANRVMDIKNNNYGYLNSPNSVINNSVTLDPKQGIKCDSAEVLANVKAAYESTVRSPGAPINKKNTISKWIAHFSPKPDTCEYSIIANRWKEDTIWGNAGTWIQITPSNDTDVTYLTASWEGKYNVDTARITGCPTVKEFHLPYYKLSEPDYGVNNDQVVITAISKKDNQPYMNLKGGTQLPYITFEEGSSDSSRINKWAVAASSGVNGVDTLPTGTINFCQV